jgi:hypothetical protein
MLTREGASVRVIPRDGLRVRLHVMRDSQRLHLELDHDGFAAEQPVVIGDGLDRLQFVLENRSGGAHETGLWIAGLPDGNYELSVDGRKARSFAGGPRRTKIALPIAASAATRIAITRMR